MNIDIYLIGWNRSDGQDTILGQKESACRPHCGVNGQVFQSQVDGILVLRFLFDIGVEECIDLFCSIQSGQGDDSGDDAFVVQWMKCLHLLKMCPVPVP